MPRIRYHQHFERRMEDADNLSDEVTVVDVYDLASDIGKECERIIELYGADAVSSLIPKVVNTLELLENLAVKNGSENTQLLELKSKISQLENDKLERAECRQKFEKELEAIEEQWRAESKELMGLVSRLQEENRRLLKIQGTTQQVTVSPSPEIVNEGDVLQKLQTTLTKQREEIRNKDKMLHEKCCDIENMKSQIERLNGSGREFRRKHKSFQNQVRTLCDERADFLVQMQDQQRDIIVLRQRLGLAQKENEDLAKSDVSYPSNKAVYDLDDPNRPRFTTSELKDILHERNELKSRISDLEDELETYRPKAKVETCKKLIPLNEKVNNILNSYNLILEEINPVDEDAPVQGPLPYEPDDAPWKRSSESGIRKFFRKIFSESSSGSSFPRRSLSTLTKMALSATDEPIPV